MAITSSKVLNTGKVNIAGLLVDSDSPYSYTGIGVGNDTNAAAEGNTGLRGDELNFKDGNISTYTSGNNSYISQWNSSFVYSDLTSHIFREVVVSQNASNNSGNCLLRGVYDDVTLGADDSISLTIMVSIDEGS